ncbi:MFS transporter [Kineosporia rhizophila]|uniref:MFS transporter n=1 Tax=Kineosporia rhizophila TaxID=84633 RepID=UPI001E422752|nr:MFS transporter [Kineosporia rhizophila]MCE0538674.1 MFS transporter [Kineosporia rhizophila]
MTVTVEETAPAGTVSAVLGLLVGLAISGSSAVAVVLPAAAADPGLDMSGAVSAWVLSGYALMLAVFTPVFGRLADLLGLRRPIVAGVSVMALGAAGSALAANGSLLIAARLVQGVGAASVTVLGAALISRLFDGPARATVLGRVAGLGAAISALAPLLAGLLEGAVGWRPVVALPAIALFLLPLLLRLTPAERGVPGRFDLPGATYLIATAAGAILLIQAPSNGAAVGFAGGLALVLGLPLLVRHVRAGGQFLPRAVVTSRAVILGATAAAGIPAAWFALLVAVPGSLADQNWSARQIGFALLPAALAALTAIWTSRPVIARLGTDLTLLSAAGLAAVALGIAALGEWSSSPALLMLSVALVALAFGHGQPAMMAHVGAVTPGELRGAALGIATLVFLTGGSLGSALAGGLDGVAADWLTPALTALLPVGGVMAALVLRRSELGPAQPGHR